ncbi:MAG TPA: hypothetical protein VHW23_05610 [Kofleriaceae bacterium]|nr:hypothetical protein [Kofleriaceae bacterium]
MTFRPFALAALILAGSLVGCYNPKLKNNLACGLDGSCPPGETCGADQRCHGAGEIDAATDGPSTGSNNGSPDAPPVGCASDHDCQMPPDKCSLAGTCNLASHTCSFGSVDCSAMNDACNAGTCEPSTGSCVKMPAHQGQTCMADSCGSFGACAGTAGVCGAGMQSQSCTAFACNAGACTGSTVTRTQPCSTDGIVCGQSTTTCDDTRCGGAPDNSCTGTEPCTKTDFVCSNQTCTPTPSNTTKSCVEPNGTTCATTTVTSCSCVSDHPATCAESGTQSCTQTTFSCSAGACNSSASTVHPGSCTVNTDGNSCSLRCPNGFEECSCGGGACGVNCGPCQT